MLGTKFGVYSEERDELLFGPAPEKAITRFILEHRIKQARRETPRQVRRAIIAYRKKHNMRKGAI